MSLHRGLNLIQWNCKQFENVILWLLSHFVSLTPQQISQNTKVWIVSVQITERQYSNTFLSHSQRQKDKNDVTVFKGFCSLHFPCATWVWFFSIVCFQMSPQTIFTRRCKVALVAFCAFLNVSSKHLPEKMKIHICLTFLLFSPVCVVKYVLKSPAQKDA